VTDEQMSMEHWSNGTHRRNLKYSHKTYSSVT